LSPTPDRRLVNFRNAELAELRHRFRAPVREILAGAEILIEEASTLRNERALDLLRHIHSAGLAALNDIGQTLSNRDAVESAEVELLSAKIRPRVERILASIEAIDRETGLVPEDWLEDIEHISFNARSLVRMMDSASFQKAAEEGEASAATVEPGAPRLLVVGGEAMERKVLSRRLERQGYAAADAHDASAALDLVATEPIDLVLLDLMMPAMSAFELLERLKANQRLRKIPVVVVAALDETERVIRALQMGAEDYLVKPFEPLLLRVRVNCQLDRRRLREQLAKLRRRDKAEG